MSANVGLGFVAATLAVVPSASLLLDDPTLSIPCGCCGIMLTNPESIRRGIGPICAGKWGF